MITLSKFDLCPELTEVHCMLCVRKVRREDLIAHGQWCQNCTDCSTNVAPGYLADRVSTAPEPNMMLIKHRGCRYTDNRNAEGFPYWCDPNKKEKKKGCVIC